VGKLFTPTVPSGVEGRLDQLTPGIAGTSVAITSKSLTCAVSGLPSLSSLINRVPVGYGRVSMGDAASVGWQVTLCDPVWHAGFSSGAVLISAILLYL